MSDNAQSAAPPAGSGIFQSIDFLMTSAQRVAEGVIGFKLANAEAKAKAQQLQWQSATMRQLYSQQAGGAGSFWSGLGGMGGIQMPGQPISQAGMFGGPVMAIGIGLGLAYLFFKK